MILGGIILYFLGWGFIILSSVLDIHKGWTVLLAYIGGVTMMLGIVFVSSPMKDRKDDNFQVKTKSAPVIKKEVFIDKENNADTTYYYVFENSDVMPIK